MPRHVAARVVDGYVAPPDDPWARGLERLTPLAALAAPLAAGWSRLCRTLVDPRAIGDAARARRGRFGGRARRADRLRRATRCG
ncbi:MAG: hypothetical protein HS111_16105 [Kofleriaceae bacterium]|nr:hypothetical protein [Kofleriaceae bacterium]